MIKKFQILFLFIGMVFSDEHIPREVDPSIHVAPAVDGSVTQKDSIPIHIDKEVNQVVDGAVLHDSPDESHKDSAIKSLLDTPEGQQLPNAGTGFFRDASYVTFTILIEKRSTDCFFYKARKSFDIDFQVLKGGEFDIALSIYDVNNKKVSFHKPASDGTVKVAVPTEMVNTDYSICLDNKQCSWHLKKVFLMIDVEGPNGISHPDLQSGEYGQMQQHISKLDSMNSALSNVYQSLMKVEQHQERRRLVESIDRSIMESNFEYVTFWAIIQIAMMLIVAGLQLLMIRSLFDSKYAVCGKIWKSLNDWTGGRF